MRRWGSAFDAARRGGFLCGVMALMAMCVIASSSGAASPDEHYDRYCKSCHGADGSGKGPAAAVLKTFPGNFTDCEAMKSRKREALVAIITDGGGSVGKSSQMPAFGKKFSPEEVGALADYVRTHFCGGH